MVSYIRFILAFGFVKLKLFFSVDSLETQKFKCEQTSIIQEAEENVAQAKTLNFCLWAELVFILKTECRKRLWESVTTDSNP